MLDKICSKIKLQHIETDTINNLNELKSFHSQYTTIHPFVLPVHWDQIHCVIYVDKYLVPFFIPRGYHSITFLFSILFNSGMIVTNIVTKQRVPPTTFDTGSAKKTPSVPI